MIETKLKQPRKTLTLAQYVRNRNGVPLGASGSLGNMLKRSLGAGSFAKVLAILESDMGLCLRTLHLCPIESHFAHIICPCSNLYDFRCSS